MSKELKVLDKIKKDLTHYDDLDNVRGIDDEEELNIIKTALKRLKEQDQIIKVIQEIIKFDKKLPEYDIDENNHLIFTVAMSIQRNIENSERKLLRNWVLKTCFPKELKEYERLKNLKLMPYPQKNGKEYRQDVIKRLSALEILKEKRVNLEYLKCSETYEQYCLICSYGQELAKEEYDLLKEVLL